jgi:integrase
MRADKVEPEDVADFLRTFSTRPGVARNVFNVLSSAYRWARRQGYVGRNPAEGLSPDKARPRERVLTEMEVRAAWHAAPHAGDYGRILRLCMLTGARREEIGGLQWTEVNLEARQLELPTSRVKNGRPFILPLSDLAVAQLPALREGYPNVFGGRPGRPFQGWHEGGDRLALKLGYKPSRKKWTLHDLRRTMVTIMSEKGLAEPWVIEAVVNHVSGHRAGVAGTYNRAAYAEQKRAALKAWAETLLGIVEGRAN